MMHLFRTLILMVQYIVTIAAILVIAASLIFLGAYFWPWSMAVVVLTAFFAGCWYETREDPTDNMPDYPY